jgi:hypothetical protein
LELADAQRLEEAFAVRLTQLHGSLNTSEAPERSSSDFHQQGPTLVSTSAAAAAGTSHFFGPEPRRIRDKDHLRFVAKQPCLICGRTPTLALIQR